MKTFFSRYYLDIPQPNDSYGSTVPDDVVGQVLTKSLLSVLKHKTLDKSIERCELCIYDGAQPGSTAENNDVESKLVIRMHCKHGVVKTHCLLLMSHGTLLAPSVSDQSEECRVIIGSRILKEMLEHFPTAKGKSDPRLVWSFGETEVGVKSLDGGIDNKGKVQITTELTVNASEFDDYLIHEPPMTLAFHLREFSATIAYADSMNLSLVLRFTDPAAPLYIEIDGENDSAETLFVISTSQVHGAPIRVSNSAGHTASGGPKREREERTVTPAPSKKLIRAVHPVDTPLNGSNNLTRVPSKPASSPVPRISPSGSCAHVLPPASALSRVSKEPDSCEPLFLPLSPNASDAAYKGLQFSSTPMAELSTEFPLRPINVLRSSQETFNETDIEATQKGERIDFRPLFED